VAGAGQENEMTRDEWMTVLHSMTMVCQLIEKETCTCTDPECKADAYRDSILEDISQAYPAALEMSGIDQKDAPMQVKVIKIPKGFMAPGEGTA
jgi:hypothetical protein